MPPFLPFVSAKVNASTTLSREIPNTKKRKYDPKPKSTVFQVSFYKELDNILLYLKHGEKNEIPLLSPAWMHKFSENTLASKKKEGKERNHWKKLFSVKV